MQIKPKTNTIFQGDNLEIMQCMPDDFVDLCYIDSPFFTQRDYKNIWGDKESIIDYDGSDPLCPIDGFSDKKCYFERNIKSGEKGLNAYLEWMRMRLLEIHRILKPTGSFYCHLDHHAVHYIKVILDEIFGYENFINEIIWHYTGGGRSKNYFSRKHDSILWYSKNMGKQIFNIDKVRIPYKETSGYAKNGITSKTGKKYRPHPLGTPVDDVWDIPIINPMSNERTGYPTQKPLALLERIIKASSNEGDLVFDCFVGCGTSMHAAHNLKRKWIGIDISPTAVKVNEKRLKATKAKVRVLKYKKNKGVCKFEEAA